MNVMITSSFRENYDPVRYNGTRDGEEPVKSAGSSSSRGGGGGGGKKEGGADAETFSFSDLPRLDYGSGDERESKESGGGGGGGRAGGVVDEQSRDQMALALRELSSASR